MEPLNEEQLVLIELDFEELKKNQLNESFLAMFGGIIGIILKGMFGKHSAVPPMRFSGKRSDISSFARTIGSEKTYIETAKKYGLDDPRTYKNKSKLDLAAKNFQATTGIAWPFN